MLSKEGIAELKERLTTVRLGATNFFTAAQEFQDGGLVYRDIWNELLTAELREQGEQLRSTIKRLSVDIAGAVRGSPLLDEADQQDLRHNTRGMLASIHFHQYRHWGLYVHHDEGTVLG